jgi:hypothetical protein
MSLWGSLLGIGAGVAAGVATGNPAVGIAVGGTILQGDQQASAAKNATTQAVAATEKAQGQADALYGGARDEQRRVFDGSMAGLQPYISLGHGSLGNLGGMVGLQPSHAPTMSSQPYAPQSLASLAAHGDGRPIVDPEGLRPQQAAMANASGYGKNLDRGDAMAGRGLVRVEAPTGEQQWMPRAHADQAVARGARVLG